MQIRRLRLLNFRQHEHTELELGAGLTGIIGPNGAGKTTLLEAIAWAMYGMPAARGSRESIRRRGAPPRSRVEVELEFALGAHHYRILRTLHQAELYQDGDPAPVANSLAAVTERVTRLLGMTREEFFNTYFTGQKELAVMAAMSAPERAQFLSRVLGYERIRAAQDRLKEKRSALRARLDALRAAIGDLGGLDVEAERAAERVAAAERWEREAGERLALAERRLGEVRPEWERLQQLRERALELETDLRVADHRLAAATEQVERLERQAAEAAGAAARLEAVRLRLAPLPGLREEFSALERQAGLVAQRQGMLAQVEDVRRHLASVEERAARLPSATALAAVRERVSELRASLTAVVLDVENERTKWVRDSQDAKTNRQRLRDQYEDLKEQRERLVKAGPEGDCPTCNRPLGAEYDKVLGVLDRQMEQVVSNGNYYKQRIEQLQIEPSELDEVERRRVTLEQEQSEAIEELGRLEAQAQDASSLSEERARLGARIRELETSLGRMVETYDEARHQAVAGEIRALEPLALEAERLKVSVDRGAAVAAELDGARRERDAGALRAADLRARLQALAYSEQRYREAKDAESAAEQSRRDAEVDQVRAKAERSAAAEAVAAVARRRREREEREREADATARDLALHQELDRALSELRTELNATLRPDLSELASGFVRDLTNGRYTELELDEEYGATLVDDGDPKSVISGGEEDVANLALRLAISQMIAERAGQPLSLLILDEIFGSLDEDRRVAVVDLLRSLADRFPQVILITHIDSVREGFDRVVRVGLDVASGVATVKDEPLGGHDVAA
ncbi:MAG TPA: SMC family ATPase [Gemmatimonadales bacterium]|nr:SMC family ATPase [Gemmatimonadales bacterium]